MNRDLLTEMEKAEVEADLGKINKISGLDMLKMRFMFCPHRNIKSAIECRQS